MDLGQDTTLESGIEVGPTVINLAFFSRPYSLIRDYIKVIQMVIYYIGHVYLRPYVYFFVKFSRPYAYSLPYVYYGL